MVWVIDVSLMTSEHLPNVDLLRARLIAYHLGRHPSDGARKRHLGRSIIVQLATGAKVADLQHVLGVDQHIGRLEIAVNDFVMVQVIHARSNLLRPIDHLRRGQCRAIFEIFTQLSVRAEFHHDAERIFGGRHANEGDYVAMLQLAQVAYLRLALFANLFNRHLSVVKCS